ncbi:MAG TPA: immunoglobulin domain-containing protein, partial [Verrucomicrobiae bacterium]|nr:immunoglobulin domain-containing protein [Verrucomicrobiae bacterium]
MTVRLKAASTLPLAGRVRRTLVLLWLASVLATSARAACTACTSFAPGQARGVVSIKALTEASGIAASRRNPGVLWTHNDGSKQDIYALDSSGARLATFTMTTGVGDTEDIAVGPGPVAGQPYLYVGDIGGNVNAAGVRSSVTIVRVPEPEVDLAWASAPHATAFAGEESFQLSYPDGNYDAESLLVDPVSGDVLVATKQDNLARVYRANLNSVSNQSSLVLQYLCTIPFSKASAGDISRDGSQIAFRREDYAMIWTRCPGESVATALARPGAGIPVIGPPTEPNGEGLGFLADGTGYVTISEGVSPVIYFFQSLCPVAPTFTLGLSNVTVLAGEPAQFEANAAGYPPPSFSWRFNGAAMPGQTNSFLVLPKTTLADSGSYSVIASNAVGTATNTA